MKTNAAMQGKAMSVEEEKIQGGVQSLEVGLTVLDALTAHNAPMMLKELSEVLSMHPAKVHRYVVSLIRKGYAQQLTDGRYSLGGARTCFWGECTQTNRYVGIKPALYSGHSATSELQYSCE